MAILIAAACVAPSSASAADEAIARGADEPLPALAQRLLPPHSELMADPVEVELPPLGRVAVLLFRDEDKPEVTNYTGWVLVPDRAGAGVYRKAVLPAMGIIDGQFDVFVESIFAAAVGVEPGRDLCVLYQYYRPGSGTDSGYSTEIYHWTGSAFERRGEAGHAMRGLTTAGKVREKLKRWRPAAAKR